MATNVKAQTQGDKGPGIPWNPNANKLHKQSVPQTKGNTGGTTGPRGQV
jgi:hypothetical protein